LDKKYKRAKSLVNVGEVSKAMSAILSNGVAKVDSEVLSQLSAKHPSRPRAVRLPTEEEIENERTTSWPNQSWPNQSEAVSDMTDRKMDMDIGPWQTANEGVSPEYSSNFPYLVIGYQ